MTPTPESVEAALAWADGLTCSDGKVPHGVTLASALRESRSEIAALRADRDEWKAWKETHSRLHDIVCARAIAAESRLAEAKAVADLTVRWFGGDDEVRPELDAAIQDYRDALYRAALSAPSTQEKPQ